MPIGSIGPTRGRCLEHLRQLLAEMELSQVPVEQLAAGAALASRPEPWPLPAKSESDWIRSAVPDSWPGWHCGTHRLATP